MAIQSAMLAAERAAERNQFRAELSVASIFCPILTLNVWAMDFVDGNYGQIAIEAGLAILGGYMLSGSSGAASHGDNLFFPSVSGLVHHLYHGTSASATVSLASGGPLSAAVAMGSKMDGPLGFFLGTIAEDATFFAVRRGNYKTLLKVAMAEIALCDLEKAGASLRKIPIGKSAATFAGDELFVPAEAFNTYNFHLNVGNIDHSIIPFPD